MELVESDEDKYLKYIIESIEEYKKQVKLIHNGQILPAYLNRALGEYGSHSATLTSEYARITKFIVSTKRQYDEWYSKVFMETRQRLQNEATNSKGIAVKEIEMAVKTYHSDKYFEFKEAIENAEIKKDFVGDLIKFWAKQDQILNNLSFNMRSELKSLYVEERANGETEQEKVANKRRGTLKEE